MRSFIAALSLGLLFFAGAPMTSAAARGHHAVQHHRHQAAHYRARRLARSRVHRRMHHARYRAVRHGDGRPAAWCGWWLGRQLGLHDRALWLARNWAHVGASAGGPRVGAIVVWPHHVGIITAQIDDRWVVKSGNDGHAVRERPRSLAGAIAFRTL